MTKLHKLIRISHDGTTFFYPAGNRTEHGPLFDSEAPVAERRLRRPRPKRPDRSLAAHCPNGGTGSAPARRTRKNGTPHRTRKARNTRTGRDHTLLSCKRRPAGPDRVETDAPQIFKIFFIKSAPRTIRHPQVPDNFVPSQPESGQALPSATPAPPASDSNPDQRNKRSVHFLIWNGFIIFFSATALSGAEASPTRC